MFIEVLINAEHVILLRWFRLVSILTFPEVPQESDFTQNLLSANYNIVRRASLLTNNMFHFPVQTRALLQNSCMYQFIYIHLPANTSHNIRWLHDCSKFTYIHYMDIQYQIKHINIHKMYLDLQNIILCTTRSIEL